MDDATKGAVPGEEEIDALLGRALEEEKLCVSEELLQKTLRRIKTEEKTKEGRMLDKKQKRVPGYACVAAAAVFVFLVGGSVLAGRAGIQNSKEIETAPEMAERQDEKADHAGKIYAYSTAADTAEDLENYFDAVEDGNAGQTCLGATRYPVSGKLQEAFGKAGFVLTDTTAECFELVQRQTDWGKELAEWLETQEQEVLSLPSEGAYEYFLVRENGEQRLIASAEPLDLLVRMETTEGGLWCLFGETVKLYAE